MDKEKIIIQGEVCFKKLSKIIIVIFPVLSVLFFCVGHYLQNQMTYDIASFCTGVGVIFLVISIAGILLFLYVNRMSLTVTNNRIYGNVSFGRKLDLPIRNIIQVKLLRNDQIWIIIPTGIINYSLIKNATSVYKELDKLIDEMNDKLRELNGGLTFYCKPCKTNKYVINDFLKELKQWNVNNSNRSIKMFINNNECSNIEELEKELRDGIASYTSFIELFCTIGEDDYINAIYIKRKAK